MKKVDWILELSLNNDKSYYKLLKYLGKETLYKFEAYPNIILNEKNLKFIS